MKKLHCKWYAFAFRNLFILSVLIIVVMTCQKQEDASKMTPQNLQCEYRNNPPGIDILQPRLSWQMAAPAERGEKQTAYRIMVASSRDALQAGDADLWDSGKVLSGQSIQVPYDGEPLKAHMHCYWKVMTWNKDGSPSRWSEPAWWSMGMLQKEDWTAKWISTSKEDTSPWYRQQFTVDDVPDQAMVYVASLGYSELYMNGEKVGDEVLAPAVSNYEKRSYYQTYDVTPYMTEGANCIGIWMGQGWYSKGYPGVVHHSPVVRAQLVMNNEEKRISVVTDSTWLTHSSSRTQLGSWRWGDFGGELLDARKDKPDWNRVNASTADWVSTVEMDIPDVPCTAQYCTGNRELDPIAPVTVESLDTSRILVDFGTNLTGFMQMTFRNLEAGEKITLYYADKDARSTDFIGHKHLMMDGFSTLGQWDEFISAGAAEEEFRNMFNYHGFRYAIIEGLSYMPEKADMRAIPVEGNLEEVGSFRCSNDLYNRINELVVWTYRCLNLAGQTVDCPHRERLGYGDGQTIMDLGCFNFYAPAMYSKWSQNWWDEQREDGFVMYTAPAPNLTGGGPAWSAMSIVVPWKTYLFYNDKRLLEQGYPYMKRYIDFLADNCKDGLLQDLFSNKWNNLGDWVPPGRGMDKADWVDDTSRRLFNDCYRLYMLDIMEQVATLLGKTGDAQRFGEERAFSREKIHATYYNAETGTYANGEQPYLILPLMTGVTPDTLKTTVFDNYVEELLVSDKGHLNSGMIGTQKVVDYLIEADRNDLVDTFVNKTTYPGWGYFLEIGATTCPEQWNGNFSQIHSCFPYIGGWFYRGLAGIQWDPESPGFKNVMLRPGIVNSVDWVECSYRSPYGTIVSNWKKEGERFEWEISVPANSTATLYMPGSDIKEGGNKNFQSGHITFLRQQDNYRVFKLESGDYFFTSKDVIQ